MKVIESRVMAMEWWKGLSLETKQFYCRKNFTYDRDPMTLTGREIEDIWRGEDLWKPSRDIKL